MELNTDEPEMVFLSDEDRAVYERLQLLDALEIAVTPDDPERKEKLNFSWNLQDYTEDHLWIELDFEDPTVVSEDSEFDTLSITFWGTDYFKNEYDEEVEIGTTVFYPLPRQFSSEDEVEEVNEIADSISWIAILSFLLVAPVITAGSLLPFWIFVNSLQIISHMILLRTIMPANAHLFLKKWNNLVRWYD